MKLSFYSIGLFDKRTYNTMIDFLIHYTWGGKLHENYQKLTKCGRGWIVEHNTDRKRGLEQP